jgi:DUF971 family protein
VTTPVSIRVRRQRQELELAYDDGSTLCFSAEFLRVQPPAAPGSEGPPPVVGGKREVELVTVQPAGHYALRLVFSDGFESGHYSWAYLRALGREYPVRWRRYLNRLEDVGLDRG